MFERQLEQSKGIDPREIDQDTKGKAVARLLDETGIGSVDASINRYLHEQIANIQTAHNLRQALNEDE
jgi:hypothetical protein